MVGDEFTGDKVKSLAVVELSLLSAWKNLYTGDLSSYFLAASAPPFKPWSLMDAWPFLFSKSAGSERRVVVLPELLKGEAAARLIPHVTAATLSEGATGSGEALLLREVPHSTLGPLHVVFRNRPVTKAELGHAPDDLFPEFVTEGFIARGAEPPAGYSQAHLDAASKAVAGKLTQCERSNTWGESDALSDLKLELGADASAKLNLTAVHGSDGVARAHYEDLRSAWRAEAGEETRRAATVKRAVEGPIAWTEKLRRAMPEAGPKRAFLFTAVAGVTLGGLLAWQHWTLRRDKEKRTTGLERVRF